MSDGALQKLYFQIGLIDKVLQPSKRAGKSIMALQNTVKNAAMDIATGGSSISRMELLGKLAEAVGRLAVVSQENLFAMLRQETRSMQRKKQICGTCRKQEKKRLLAQ